ncbi:MAG: hypothetical protein ABSE07_11445 [Methanoregula sp.]|jgi:predicted enzyme related to lactoylglutathione lyase
MGGMYKRQMPGTPFTPYVMVEEPDKIIAEVEKLGGKIIMPEMMIESVGFTVVHPVCLVFGSRQ